MKGKFQRGSIFIVVMFCLGVFPNEKVWADLCHFNMTTINQLTFVYSAPCETTLDFSRADGFVAFSLGEIKEGHFIKEKGLHPNVGLTLSDGKRLPELKPRDSGVSKTKSIFDQEIFLANTIFKLPRPIPWDSIKSFERKEEGIIQNQGYPPNEFVGNHVKVKFNNFSLPLYGRSATVFVREKYATGYVLYFSGPAIEKNEYVPTLLSDTMLEIQIGKLALELDPQKVKEIQMSSQKIILRNTQTLKFTSVMLGSLALIQFSQPWGDAIGKIEKIDTLEFLGNNTINDFSEELNERPSNNIDFEITPIHGKSFSSRAIEVFLEVPSGQYPERMLFGEYRDKYELTHTKRGLSPINPLITLSNKIPIATVEGPVFLINTSHLNTLDFLSDPHRQIVANLENGPTIQGMFPREWWDLTFSFSDKKTGKKINLKVDQLKRISRLREKGSSE